VFSCDPLAHRNT